MHLTTLAMISGKHIVRRWKWYLSIFAWVFVLFCAYLDRIPDEARRNDRGFREINQALEAHRQKFGEVPEKLSELSGNMNLFDGWNKLFRYKKLGPDIWAIGCHSSGMDPWTQETKDKVREFGDSICMLMYGCVVGKRLVAGSSFDEVEKKLKTRQNDQPLPCEDN